MDADTDSATPPENDTWVIYTDGFPTRVSVPKGLTPDGWRVRSEFLGLGGRFPKPAFREAQPLTSQTLGGIVEKLTIKNEKYVTPAATPPQNNADTHPAPHAAPKSAPHAAPAEEALAMKISADWVSIVGDEIAQHALPGALSNGMLTVFVKGSVWYAELRRSGLPLLKDKLNAHLATDSAPTPIRALRILRS